MTIESRNDKVSEAEATGETPLRLRHFLPYRLSISTNLVSDVIAGAYRRLFQISIAEWRVIAVLGEQSGLNQQAVGAATRMDKLTVSRATAGLVERGLILRRVNPEDRRAQLLRLSQKGREVYDAVTPKALELEARLLDGFSARERAQLEKMLGRLETAALALGGESGGRDAD